MNYKILVVDDEEDIRELLKSSLEDEGYIVQCAESAEEALDTLSKQSFHVIYMDLKLPGIDGVELCKRVRKDNPVVFIFVMTGYSSLFDLATCREAGCDDFFTKPFDTDTMLEETKRALQKLDRWKKKN